MSRGALKIVLGGAIPKKERDLPKKEERGHSRELKSYKFIHVYRQQSRHVCIDQ